MTTSSMESSQYSCINYRSELIVNENGSQSGRYSETLQQGAPVYQRWDSTSGYGAGESLAQQPETATEESPGKRLKTRADAEDNLMDWLLESFASNGIDGRSLDDLDGQKSMYQSDVDLTSQTKPVIAVRSQANLLTTSNHEYNQYKVTSPMSASSVTVNSGIHHYSKMPRSGSTTNTCITQSMQKPVYELPQRYGIELLLDQLTSKVKSLREMDNSIVENLEHASSMLTAIQECRLLQAPSEFGQSESQAKTRTFTCRRRQEPPTTRGTHSRFNKGTTPDLNEADNPLSRSLINDSTGIADFGSRTKLPFRGSTLNRLKPSKKVLTPNNRPLHNSSPLPPPMSMSTNNLVSPWNLVEVDTDNKTMEKPTGSKWDTLSRSRRAFSVTRQTPNSEEKRSKVFSGTLGRWNSRRETTPPRSPFAPVKRLGQALSQLNLADWSKKENNGSGSKEQTINSSNTFSTIFRGHLRRQSVVQRPPLQISAPVAGTLKHHGKCASLVQLEMSAPASGTPPISSNSTAIPPSSIHQSAFSSRISTPSLDRHALLSKSSNEVQSTFSRLHAANRQDGEVDSDSGKFSWDSNGSTSVRTDSTNHLLH